MLRRFNLLNQRDDVIFMCVPSASRACLDCAAHCCKQLRRVLQPADSPCSAGSSTASTRRAASRPPRTQCAPAYALADRLSIWTRKK